MEPNSFLLQFFANERSQGKYSTEYYLTNSEDRADSETLEAHRRHLFFVDKMCDQGECEEDGDDDWGDCGEDGDDDWGDCGEEDCDE